MLDSLEPGDASMIRFFLPGQTILLFESEVLKTLLITFSRIEMLNVLIKRLALFHESMIVDIF